MYPLGLLNRRVDEIVVQTVSTRDHRAEYWAASRYEKCQEVTFRSLIPVLQYCGDLRPSICTSSNWLTTVQQSWGEWHLNHLTIYSLASSYIHRYTLRYIFIVAIATLRKAIACAWLCYQCLFSLLCFLTPISLLSKKETSTHGVLSKQL